MMKNNTEKSKKIKILRKTDIVLIAAFLIFASAFYFMVNLGFETGDTAIIKLNGEIYAETSLNEEKDVEIYSEDGKLLNIVRIKDKRAVMIYADCPDKRCMRSVFNNLTVCLPNKVIVEIIGSGKLKDKRFDIII